MISACGVTVNRAGRTVLDDVDVHVPAGEIVALVGPNGAGKSTLLSVLSGDLAMDTGTVLLDGKPVRSYSPAALARLRAVLPQQSAVSFPFTVADVVAMGRAPWAGTPQQRHDATAVLTALEATELNGLAHRPVTSLSGGERARTSLARVLAQDTPLVLLDEPTASLDLRHQELVLRQARRLAHAGRAVLAVLHDLTLAAAYADTIVMLADGHVVATGLPREVLRAEPLGAIYGQTVDVLVHPRTGHPLVVPSRDQPAADQANGERRTAWKPHATARARPELQGR